MYTIWPFSVILLGESQEDPTQDETSIAVVHPEIERNDSRTMRIAPALTADDHLMLFSFYRYSMYSCGFRSWSEASIK
jgi:hypothetical protein